MKLRALKNHILIEQPEDTEHSKNGIYIASKNPPIMKGKVISVGRGTFNEKGKWITPQVKEGQTILFSKGSGEGVEYENKKYIFFKPEDVLAIVKENG